MADDPRANGASAPDADIARTFLAATRTALDALADLAVPADSGSDEAWPAASTSGAAEFLAGILAERVDWIPRVQALLDAPAPTEHEQWEWFATLVNGGYYADPGNGGNRDATSWRMIGWHPEPAGGWKVAVPVAEAPSVRVTPAGLKKHYDAIVIGSGAGGGVAAAVLAEAGRSVLVVEAGPWPSIAELAHDHIRNPRSIWNVSLRTGPPDAGHPRVLRDADGEHVLRPSDSAYGLNASTAGGGTRIYGAQAWRFSPLDFRMASTYGVPHGSSLADWPIGYDDLEPYYQRAEWELGVSGDVTDGPHSGPRGRPYPMPPLPGGIPNRYLRAGAEVLGLPTLAPPLLINSRPYLGRAACAQCAQCIGFACPVNAKNGSQNTMLTRAFATGHCAILLDTTVARIVTDAAGRVTGAALVGETPGPAGGAAGEGLWRAEVGANEVVVAAGAVESARLLLNSPSAREPHGLGNDTDQVGRHLQAHLYGGATAVFDEKVVDLVGPGPSIATTAHRHGNDGIIGGGILANEFVPTPSNTYRYLVDAGFIRGWGVESKRGMRDLADRMLRVMGPIQEVTTAESRVTVDPRVTDRFGIPVARLSGHPHEEDYRARDLLAERAGEWLEASGAARVALNGIGSRSTGPSVGQHQAGTCRMGDEPSRSVVDSFGRVWGHENLRIADGSVHVTNGGVNPVLTILATAFRTAEHMVRGEAPKRNPNPPHSER